MRGERVVVGVSGGADSVALLRTLCDLRSELNLTLHVAHLDHGLRPGSAEDAAFVLQMAAGLQVPTTVESVDVASLARAQKTSVEDAGRRARYAFFERVAVAVGAGAVATGHTRDDQVETVAMRLLRPAPWEGLAGIPPARPLGGIRVIRPLLEVTRAEIVDFLASANVEWRDDPTNRDVRIDRNWVRLELLPALEASHPHGRQLLWNLGETARAADQLLAAHAEQASARISRRAGSGIRFALDAFRGHPPDLQRRMLRWAVREVAGTSGTLPAVVEKQGARLAAGGRAGDEVDLGLCVLRCGYEMLEVVPPQPAPPTIEYRLAVPGEVVAEAFGMVISAELLDGGWGGQISVRPDDVVLDAAAAGSELRIRSWRRGDRFTPLGLRGKKKVHDLFVDEKVPRWERGRIPLLTDAQGRILWVVGRRIADAGRVTDATRRVVRLRARPLTSPEGMQGSA